MSVRLLIVDRSPLVRWGLARMVQPAADTETVVEADNAADALRQVRTSRPNVVIIGADLPDMSGLALARQLRQAHPDLGLVLLASQPDDRILFGALDAGVSSFVDMHNAVDDVLAAIRHAVISPRSFSAAGLADAMRRQASDTNRVTLSRREAQILDLLQQGESVPSIAAQLFVSLSTAKTYVARLYEKLGAANRAQALMTAVRLGLIEAHRQEALVS